MRKTRKMLATIMAVVMTTGVFSTSAFAEDETKADVFVTIADANGDLALTQQKVTVTDIDEDGALTINDALYLAHEAKFEGGAAAGYKSSVGAYGLALDKLWGTENGGSYGYYVNNNSAWSLTDIVKEGDYINAFVYTDLTAWSDKYCYFDVNSKIGTADKEINLILSMAGYDENYNPAVYPVEGAVITVNGEATDVKTDAEGKAVIKLPAAEGEYVISATSDKMTMVPPVCKVTAEKAVEESTTPEETTPQVEDIPVPPTGDSVNRYMILVLAIAMLAGTAVLAANNKDKKKYEK